MNNPSTGIRAEGVTKHYELGAARIDVLKGVSMNVVPGETVSIMGASGAGKSTLLHSLGGLDRPTDGNVLLDGENIYSAPSNRRNRMRALMFGFVFQSFHLLPELDVLDNIALPALSLRGALRRQAEIRARAAELLGSVGLGHRLNHRPVEMSGGEQQRAAMARALMNRPRYLFADEPTGNLDSTTTREIMSLFAQLHAEGQTIVIVTHEDEVATCCRRVVRLRDGSVDSDLPIEKDPASSAFWSARTEHAIASGAGRMTPPSATGEAAP